MGGRTVELTSPEPFGVHLELPMGTARMRAEDLQQVVSAPRVSSSSVSPWVSAQLYQWVTHVREGGILRYWWPNFSVDFATSSGVLKLLPSEWQLVASHFVTLPVYNAPPFWFNCDSSQKESHSHLFSRTQAICFSRFSLWSQPDRSWFRDSLTVQTVGIEWPRIPLGNL